MIYEYNNRAGAGAREANVTCDATHFARLARAYVGFFCVTSVTLSQMSVINGLSVTIA